MMGYGRSYKGDSEVGPDGAIVRLIFFTPKLIDGGSKKSAGTDENKTKSSKDGSKEGHDGSGK